jgi:hypothetical protein
MPKVKINSIKAEFLSSERKISDFVLRSANFYEERNDNIASVLLADRYSITENFLEDVFIRFLCGAERIVDPQPILLGSFRYISDAKQVIGGRRGYFNWNNPSEVNELANLYFKNGEPIVSALRPAYGDIENMRIIRNRIAHSSEKAATGFTKLVRREYGYNPPKMSPGRYLLDTTLNPPNNQFEYFTTVLVTVANRLTG